MALRFTFRQLEYFVAVGEVGSIAAASEKLNVSSPSISAAITQLEAEFGLVLFVRKHAQGLILTTAGRMMMHKSRQILHEADLLTKIAGEISGKVQGPLTVGCLLTFAQILLPKLRKNFEAQHENVKIYQKELDQSEIFSQARRAEIDLALTYDLDIPNDLEFIELMELPPYVMVGATHVLSQRNEVMIEELQAHPMVLLDLPHSGEYFISLFLDRGLKPQITERTRDMAVVRSLVANGFGFSLANVKFQHDLSPDGQKLSFIPIVGDVKAIRMGLVMTKSMSKTNTIQAFIDHCKTCIRAEDTTLFPLCPS
jgi:DNA-binding transcriptional LysR family regulator